MKTFVGLMLGLSWTPIMAADVVSPPMPPVISQPDTASPSSKAAAERLMAVMHSDDQFRATVPRVIGALVPSLAQGNQGREPELRKIVTEEFTTAMVGTLPMIHEANRRLLNTHFTETELGELVAFYSSPLGAKLIAAMPDVQIQMMQVGQRLGMAAMQTALPRIIQRMRAANMAVPQGA